MENTNQNSLNTKKTINEKNENTLFSSDIFDVWNNLKKKIDESETEENYMNKQVWWCSFGKNIGVEEDGKNNLFERPVLIFKRWNKDFFLGLPFTTKEDIKNYNMRYYYKYNINSKEEGYIILSQIRVFSSKRLLRKIKKMSDYDFVKVKEKIVNLLKE